MNKRSVINIIAAFETIIGISAVIGGYGLITTHGLGMPVVWLSSSIFTSYFWPGVILISIVGGSYLSSAYLLVKEHAYARESMAIAGFGLLIWIYTELYIMKQSHWLHTLYFAIGIVTLVLTMLLLKYQRR